MAKKLAGVAIMTSRKYMKPRALSPIAGGVLIVEIFGPSASGKTTFAKALVLYLRRLGLNARLQSSARPRETTAYPSGDGLASLFARLSKLPALLIAISASGRTGTADDLLPLFRPRGLLWRLRFHRYMSDLDRRLRDLREASETDEIVVFDQAYVSAVGTVAALSAPGAGSDGLGRALEIIPRADLLISLDAPRDLLHDRLKARLDSQGWVERFLELDIDTTLRQVEVFETITAQISDLGVPIIDARCRDPASLSENVAEAVARFAALRAATTKPDHLGAGRGPGTSLDAAVLAGTSPGPLSDHATSGQT